MADPALVAGHGRGTEGGLTVARFVEDSRGDLVDVLYVCATCSYGTEERANALRWPGYEWSPDHAEHCAECGVMVNNPED